MPEIVNPPVKRCDLCQFHIDPVPPVELGTCSRFRRSTVSNALGESRTFPFPQVFPDDYCDHYSRKDNCHA